jgi:type II secretory pathway predicted ATPase ExeA
MPLVILIGASGSGKTTIARAIQERYADSVDVFLFDRIGVPSIEQMILECGSREEWQRVKTIEWMVKIAQVQKTRRKQLFEGQTRLSFLVDGAATAGGLAYKPILVDCDDETRSKRLTIDRGQPELANKEMMNWARYLRHSAKIEGCEILNTSSISLDESVLHILARMDR